MPFSSIINESIFELLLNYRNLAHYYVIDYFNKEMKISLSLIDDYIRSPHIYMLKACEGHYHYKRLVPRQQWPGRVKQIDT